MMHKKSSKFTTIVPHSIVFKENRVHKFNIITVKTATAGLLFFYKIYRKTINVKGKAW